jgi:endonuclease/exonuclease/phosphatase family metal-dependent hydrolase
MRLIVTLCLLLLALVPLESTLAHPGGRDSHGGHRDASTGGYHFHEDPLAGQAFPSKEAALEALSALTSTPHPSSPAPPATSPALPETPSMPSEDTLTLASWNVRNLSTGSRSDAELGIISLILFRYDFIALQEVRDAEVVRRILQIFEKDFRVSYAAEVSGEVGHNKKERYAFLWRSDRIQQTQAGAFYADPLDKFEREPYCASFRAGTFDWTMCTVHLLFGDSEEDRRPELLQLDDVYRAFRNAGTEKDVIICGDFNFGPDDVGWAELKAEDGMQFAIKPPGKTTIADVSLYDN